MGIVLAKSAAMMVVFRCVVVVCVISSMASAAPPVQVAERFAAAQDSIDKDVFRGSYTMNVESSINKPKGGSRQTTGIEWRVAVNAAGEEDRRLVRFSVDGEDVTEEKREKFESRKSDSEEEEEEEFLSPIGEHAHRYVFGPQQVVGDHIEMSFEPVRNREDDEGITRGSIAWDAVTLDPLWLEMEALAPPKPVRELRMKLEFNRVAGGIYLRRMVTDGRAKVLLMKRNFHMEMTVSELAPAGSGVQPEEP